MIRIGKYHCSFYWRPSPDHWFLFKFGPSKKYQQVFVWFAPYGIGVTNNYFGQLYGYLSGCLVWRNWQLRSMWYSEPYAGN